MAPVIYIRHSGGFFCVFADEINGPGIALSKDVTLVVEAGNTELNDFVLDGTLVLRCNSMLMDGLILKDPESGWKPDRPVASGATVCVAGKPCCAHAKNVCINVISSLSFR